MRRVAPVLVLVLGAAALGIVLQQNSRHGEPHGGAPSTAADPQQRIEPNASGKARVGSQTEASAERAPQAAAGGHSAPQSEVRGPDTPSLGPVRGLVRDAVTRQPIAGAWLTWRRADGASLDRVFGGTEFAGLRGTQGFGMLSDEHGRFSVDRLADDLPPESVLHAAAPGYALARVRPRLAAEVVVDMQRGGALRVLGALQLPGSPLRASACPPETVGGLVPEQEVGGLVPEQEVGRLVPEQEVGGALVFKRLAAGRYTVAQGAREATVQVEAGRTTDLPWGLPARIHVAGRLEGYAPESGVLLEAEQLDGPWEQELALDPSGAFSVELPAGSYALRRVSFRTGSELTLARVDASVHNLLLSPAPSEVALELRVVLGEGAEGGPIGLAEVGRGGDRHSAERVSGDLYRVAGARPGRYHVFLPDAYVGQVELKPGHQPALAYAPFACSLRLRLPPLPAGEALRARVQLIPAALDDDPGIKRRLWPDDPAQPPVLLRGEEAELRQLIGAPGRYHAVIETDLGRVERTVNLEPNAAPLRFDLR